MEYERQSKQARQEGERAAQMAAGGVKIASAVGKQPAANLPNDQTSVIDLLSRIPLAEGGPSGSLPNPTSGGQADYRLVNAIYNFQLQMASKGLLPKSYCDGRVDPGGKTIALLNQFATARGREGKLIPTDPKRKKITFLAELAARLPSRPINWKLVGTASISGGYGPVGAMVGSMKLAPTNPPGPTEPLHMAGFGLNFGPEAIPGGIEFAPSNFPSLGSQLFAGPRTKGNTLSFEELLGPCLILGISCAVQFGSNASVILFSTGANRSLSHLPGDFLGSLSGAQNFVMDSFASCKAFACSAGIITGLSVGLSMIGAVVKAERRPLYGGLPRYFR